MKPGPWIPIDNPPIRSGRYQVRDASTNVVAMWIWTGQPGLPGYWTIEDGGMIVQGVYGLQWRGLEDFVWTSADGRETPIFALDGEHAKNILRHLFRKAQARDAKLAAAKQYFGLPNDWERGF